MERPPESLKSFADYLAQRILTEGNAQLIQFLGLSDLFKQTTSSVSDGLWSYIVNNPNEWPPNCDRVGIWERKSENGKSYFARSMDRVQEWNYWANVGRIESKEGKRRIVLIGESVARGYFYDPQFTPATALEMILQSYWGQDKVEVIDLARTELAGELVELVKSALMLEPEAVIIFAGNNWGFTFTYYPKSLDIRPIISVLREQGIPGLKRYAENRLATDVRRLVTEIASLYEARRIPLVWVIPEFNLGDWRDAETNAPHLANGENEVWIAYRKEAESALKRGDITTASKIAEKMIELDQNVCVTGLYILAECCQRSGDLDGARRYLEMARDALIWDTSRHITPRSYSVAQETLRNEVKRYGNGLVDLPQLFKSYLKDELPDRRLFLDYCHLTSEGIRIAMAAAAASIVQLIDGTNISWNRMMYEQVRPTNEAEGEALFLAALRNAHWWQAHDLIKHYCLRSIQAAPKIAQIMNSFIDIQTRRVPMLMCRSAEYLAELGSPQIQRHLLHHNQQQLDKFLLDAMADSLKRVGIEARGQLDRLRQKEHSVAHRAVNLLDYYYCASSRQPQEVMWLVRKRETRSIFSTHREYYQAYWFESRFPFIGKMGCPVRLRLTCRLFGFGKSEGTISIEVNGIRTAEAIIGRNWECWEVIVAGDLVKEGENEVLIRWPVPEFPGQRALEMIIDDIVRDGMNPMFYPVFGEIHSFKALPCDSSS